MATSAAVELPSHSTVLAVESKEETLPQVMVQHDDDAALKKKVIEDEDRYAPPFLTYWQVFVLFLGFGARAWGGPVAQIAMIKEQLVTEEKWISGQKFVKLHAIYQMLPGPEAMELCCYFGYVARGRMGAFIGGMGFLLPGFVLMLLASWVYTDYGTGNAYFQASFKTLQPAMAACIFHAVHKISNHALVNQQTHKFSELLCFVAMFGALTVAMRVNFFITLPVLALLQTLGHGKRWVWFGAVLAVFFGVYITVVRLTGPPGGQGLALPGGAGAQTEGGFFITGLLGGLLSFGGAYTSIPVIQQSTVSHGWLTNDQFLDGLALGSIMPAPLVIFSTFVGFLGGKWIGAVLMTIGMFIPAFTFNIVGIQFFEYILNVDAVAVALEGIAAGVTGFIGILGFEFLRSALKDSISPAIFALSLGFLYGFKHKLLTVTLVVAMAIAGQALYADV